MASVVVSRPPVSSRSPRPRTSSSNKQAVALSQPPTRVSASCVSLPVQTNSAGEKQIIFTAETLENVEADHTMAVDVARATVRRGYPELQFAQVDPCDDRRLVRLVTARFSPERFVEIAAGNEQVLKQTEQPQHEPRAIALGRDRR